MGAASKAMATMPTTNPIPAIISLRILYHLHSFAHKKLWLPCGLGVRCNKTFQKLQQLIKSVSSLNLGVKHAFQNLDFHSDNFACN
jgi:hypothetical protein